MPNRRARTLALVGPLLFSTALAAQETPPSSRDTGQVATALKGGNLGMGLDVMYGLAPELIGRAGFTLSGGTSSLSGTSLYWVADALVDWQPRGWKGFRLTGGLGYLDTEPATTQVSSMGKVGAYAGIGWGNAFSRGSRWRFLVDAGTYYRLGGVYEMQYQPTAPAAGKSALDAGSQTTFVEKSRLTPTISVGASYRF